MRKKGFSTISTTLITVFSCAMLVTIAIYLMNMMLPFITYAKIQNIASKYMFVIEKYGYLMEAEKEALIQELEKQGITRDNIKLSYPTEKNTYGQLVKLEIACLYKPSNFKEAILLTVKKYSYAKI